MFRMVFPGRFAVVTRAGTRGGPVLLTLGIAAAQLVRQPDQAGDADGLEELVTTAGIRRALSPSERVHAGKESYIGYLVRATGRLDEDALATSYAAVCDAFPQFSARLAVDENGEVVLTESGIRPQIRTGAGDVERPMADLPLDQQRALIALNVVRDGDEASVCLAVHHSVADARNAIEVLATLWSCYTDVVEGVPVDLARRPMPKSLEELLAERDIHPNGPAATIPVPASRAGQPDPVVRHAAQHRLTPAHTSALAELGHREKVALNGLLCGAILLAEAEIREMALTELILRYTVDLRHRLTPPVAATEGTNVIGGVGFRVTEQLGSGAVAIGRAIGDQLRAGLDSGAVQRSVLDLLSRPVPNAKPWDPSQALAVVSMMNWGALPPLRTPDGLRLTNFRSASRMREAAGLGGYVVNTFDGRIGIDLAWPEGDPQLPRRIDCLRGQLDRLTAEL
jgi:acetyltransferase